eukprot:TRINITY_DN21046_c0_g1_i2.p1 TRINITY_DN21046_c0_g1~~TRINITY_DN21046_c0_g1_i2.p1  ORF type:complete len:225 (+),score=39.51 TRINITY_DN21046_c0_g1_i2:205-879(+)
MRRAGCVLLHGSGDTGAGIRDWAAAVVPSLLSDPNIQFAFPTAPRISYSLIGGTPSTVWFDREDLHPSAQEDDEGIARSIAAVEREVDAMTSAGIPEQNVFVVGFSMGGCLALHFGIHRPSIGGVWCMSSFLAHDSMAWAATERIAGEDGARLAEPGRLVVCHGLQDPMVLPAWSLETTKKLRACGLPVRYETYPGDHELTVEGMSMLHTWITDLSRVGQPTEN